MGIGKEFFTLMNSIGYEFSDISYLENALTHSSYSNEMKARGIRVSSNETLEFLGDAVLQLTISELIYDKFKKMGEGTLTKIRQSLVCEKTLSKIASELGIGSYLNIGKGEEARGCRENAKVLADALEAVIAGVYLDDRAQGGKKYKEVVDKLFSPYINDSGNMPRTDYKTALQQFCEKNGDAVLEYVLGSECGPEHSKTFTVTAYVNNNPVGQGSGRTKKVAEMAAAKEALTLFGVETLNQE